MLYLFKPDIRWSFKKLLLTQDVCRFLSKFYPKLFVTDFWGRYIPYPKHLTPLKESYSEVLIKVGGKDKDQYVQVDLENDIDYKHPGYEDPNYLFQVAFKKAKLQGLQPKVTAKGEAYDLIDGGDQRATILVQKELC